MLNYRVVNLVALLKLRNGYDLRELEKAHHFTRYGKTTRIALHSPANVNFSLFATGTIAARGAKSPFELKETIEWLRVYLKGYNIILDTNYRLVNIVATATVSDNRLALNELAQSLGAKASYDPTPPERAPRAVYYSFTDEKPHGIILIFGSGKAVLTGFNKFSTSAEAAKQLTEKIRVLAKLNPGVLEDGSTP